VNYIYGAKMCMQLCMHVSRDVVAAPRSAPLHLAISVRLVVIFLSAN
jgi:hypothetical protein